MGFATTLGPIRANAAFCSFHASAHERRSVGGAGEHDVIGGARVRNRPVGPARAGCPESRARNRPATTRGSKVRAPGGSSSARPASTPGKRCSAPISRRSAWGRAACATTTPNRFERRRELLREDPNLVVLQFTTPDRQGHAHGIPSPEYAAHMRSLDRDLHQLLSELGPAWTVIVTSDHGASDSGTHGADIAIQRKTPIYAYGPGIAPGVKLGRSIEQIELASTFSTLLGVPPPAHSRGHALVEWLALEPSHRARVACVEARRALRYAGAVSAAVAIPPELLRACEQFPPRSELISDTRKLVRDVDRAIASSSGRGHPALPALVGTVGLLALGVSLVIFGKTCLRLLPGALLLAVLAVGLVYQVERFSGNVPNLIRVVLLVLANLIALFVLVVPARLAAWLDRHQVLGPLLVPGMLIAAYPADAQPESFVALSVGAFALALSPALEKKPIDVLRGRGPGFSRAVALLPLCLMLLPAGTRDENVYGSWVLRHPTLLMLAALGSVGFWSLIRAASFSTRAEWRATAVGLPIVLGSLLLARVAPPLVGAQHARRAFGRSGRARRSKGAVAGVALWTRQLRLAIA